MASFSHLNGASMNPLTLANDPTTRPLSDSDIAAAVSSAISWITTIPLENIQITVREGCVRLDGEVDHWHQSHTVEELAQHGTGVRSVINHIRIRSNWPI